MLRCDFNLVEISRALKIRSWLSFVVIIPARTGTRKMTRRPECSIANHLSRIGTLNTHCSRTFIYFALCNFDLIFSHVINFYNKLHVTIKKKNCIIFSSPFYNPQAAFFLDYSQGKLFFKLSFYAAVNKAKLF